jgi:hypothetical protein
MLHLSNYNAAHLEAYDGRAPLAMTPKGMEKILRTQTKGITRPLHRMAEKGIVYSPGRMRARENAREYHVWMLTDYGRKLLNEPDFNQTAASTPHIIKSKYELTSREKILAHMGQFTDADATANLVPYGMTIVGIADSIAMDPHTVRDSMYRMIRNGEMVDLGQRNTVRMKYPAHAYMTTARGRELSQQVKTCFQLEPVSA